jgi:parallel beta-helix repeat protein
VIGAMAFVSLTAAVGSGVAGRQVQSSTAKLCTRAASPSGRDSNPGTVARPFRTVKRLADRLRPGDVGCLLFGTFSEDVSIRRGGKPGKPIVLTSAPGRRATVRGLFSVADSANDVVVSRLRLDGSTTDGRPSPQINGDRVVFRDNEVSNKHTAICFVVGGAFSDYGFAIATVIAANRIHDCGRLPRTNHDHGIYLEGSRGARVVGNVIYGNADWGVHLYPEADGSYVAHNVIDSNGGGIIVASEEAGEEYEQDHSSDRNLIELNVIANSMAKHNVEAWWGGPVGDRNVVRKNCLWNGKAGNVGNRQAIEILRNVVADPRFMNPRAGDYRLKPGSRCLRFGAGPRR